MAATEVYSKGHVLHPFPWPQSHCAKRLAPSQKWNPPGQWFTREAHYILPSGPNPTPYANTSSATLEPTFQTRSKSDLTNLSRYPFKIS